MLALIDNYDSFTYNLVQYFGELGADIRVFRNDQITLANLVTLSPTHLVISPGPGDPDNGGISNEAILRFTGKIPVLGVCLGHQCIGAVFGGQVSRAPRIMHGKTSPIYHNGQDLFSGLPSPFNATLHASRIVLHSDKKFFSRIFPPSVKMLSGWNCTPKVGCSRWRRAITSPSRVCA